MAQTTWTGSDQAKGVLLDDVQDNDTELYATKTEVENARNGEASLLAKQEVQDTAILAAQGGTSSLISATDTTNGFLLAKLPKGANITVTQGNTGGNETLTFSFELLDANINAADYEIKRAKFKDVSEVVSILGDLAGGTDDIDLEAGNVVSATVSTATQTITISNWPTSGNFGAALIYLTNGGSQQVNHPADRWPQGKAPVLTASGVDVLLYTSIDGGATVDGYYRLDLKAAV